jgi:hypothetical protein
VVDALSFGVGATTGIYAQEKNHKAERENNTNNKQKLGRELVGTGKGRRGRQGTW